jgi:hypothetical protein
MRISEDKIDKKIYHYARFAAGMRCQKLASESGEITRDWLAIELMCLLGPCIQKKGGVRISKTVVR